MASSPEEIRKHMKSYWIVGYTLFACTVLTLLLGILRVFDLGLPGVSPIDITFGLAVATFKCSLVVLVFMHLNHERGLIYKTMLFTMAFAVGLMGLTLFAQANPIEMHSDVIDEVAPSRGGPVAEGGAESNPSNPDH